MKKCSNLYTPDAPAMFGETRPACLGGRPPMNVITGLTTAGYITMYASLAATAASTAIAVDSSNKQAKQAEMNAEAQQKALLNEKQRSQLEFEENRRRLATEQKRFRAQQFAKIADSGIMTGTGTALELEADTWKQQQIEMSDRSYVNSLNQSELGYQAKSALQIGRSEAAGYRRQATGQAIEGIGSMIGTAGGAYVNAGRTTKPATNTSSSTTVMTSGK